MANLLTDSVGQGGKNLSNDVKVVIKLLNKHIDGGKLSHLAPLDLRIAGDSTAVVAAIKEFQKVVVKLSSPDGRIDPGGRTMYELRKTEKDTLEVVRAVAGIMTQIALGPPSAEISKQLWLAALLSMIDHVARPGLVRRDVLTLVDFTIPINQRRLWVVDLDGRTVRFVTHVSHGKGPNGTTRGNPVFMNGSYASSVGGFLTLHQTTAKAGHLEKMGLPARGPALIIAGLDPTNDRMRAREVIFHGASYMNPPRGVYGASWGCFATHPDDNAQIIDMIKNGSFGYAYAGEDLKP